MQCKTLNKMILLHLLADLDCYTAFMLGIRYKILTITKPSRIIACKYFVNAI